MYQYFFTEIERLGLTPSISIALAYMLTLVVLVLIARVCHFFCKRGLFRGIHYLLSYRSKTWDALLSESNFFGRASHIPTALVLIIGVENNLLNYPQLSLYIQNGLWIYLYLGSMLALFALADTFKAYFNAKPGATTLPITSLSQLFRLVIAIIVVILITSNLINQSPIYLLSGLGAVTAIIILAFRDTILGFIASIQVTSNDMVRKHDWIEMPQYGADGEVLEVGLNTVKVQNWDMTVTTIPTYSLMSDAFKNWRYMQSSGGRRVKRSLLININSIGFASPEQIEQWKSITILRPYLEAKLEEIAAQSAHELAIEHAANQRKLTNIGTFRAYITEYLQRHPQVNHQKFILVRQLASKDTGVPLECYFFVSDTRWAYYEGVQSDIFDHLFAIAPQFGITLFQAPTGTDFSGYRHD